MNTKDLIRHFGTLTAAAKAIGTSIQVVSAWNTKDRIPMGRQYEIQFLTGGQLKADAAHSMSQRSLATVSVGRSTPATKT